MRATFRRGCAVAICGALLLAGCGDDDDTADDTNDTTETTAADDSTTTTEAEADDGETIVVEAKDYEYVNLPASVPAGTKFSLSNSSAAELHEFVAIRIPDEETRPVSELVALPEEEVNQIFGSGEPATVILAMPGLTDTPGAVVGDGSISEPGRYAVVCFIPTGVDPEAYATAEPGPDGGPPSVPGADGPPHAAQGMFAELTVE